MKKLWRSGAFPRIRWASPRTRPEDWYPAYPRTTLEQDIPQLGLSLPAARARVLLTLHSHGQGSVQNLSALGGPLRVGYHTVATALDLLEGVFLVRRLPPYVANVKKRLVKSPKLYVRDTETVMKDLGPRRCYQVNASDQLEASQPGLWVGGRAPVLNELGKRPSDGAKVAGRARSARSRSPARRGMRVAAPQRVAPKVPTSKGRGPLGQRKKKKRSPAACTSFTRRSVPST